MSSLNVVHTPIVTVEDKSHWMPEVVVGRACSAEDQKRMEQVVRRSQVGVLSADTHHCFHLVHRHHPSYLVEGENRDRPEEADDRRMVGDLDLLKGGHYCRNARNLQTHLCMHRCGLLQRSHCYLRPKTFEVDPEIGTLSNRFRV